jgi:hypothetical protein
MDHTSVRDAYFRELGSLQKNLSQPGDAVKDEDAASYHRIRLTMKKFAIWIETVVQ